jgi:hypothetical protein
MSYVNTTTAPNTAILHIASGLSAKAHAFTFWFKATGDASHGSFNKPVGIVASVGDASANADTDAWGVEGNGPADSLVYLGNIDAGPEAQISGTAASLLGWVFGAGVVDSSGNLTLYTGNETTSPTTFNPGGAATVTGTVSDFFLGRPGSPGVNASGKYSSIKIWQTTLTGTEIATEWASKAPVKSGVYTYLSCDNGSTIGADQSGNGNNWTEIHTGLTTDTDVPSLFGGSTFDVTLSDTPAVTDSQARDTQFERYGGNIPHLFLD